MSDIEGFIREQVTPGLREGETIHSVAYLKSAPGGGVIGGLKAKAWFGALTDQRLVLVKTRVGAFKPLLENHGVESVERSDIEGVHAGGSRLSIAVAGRKPLQFARDRSARKTASQDALMDELTRAYGGSPAAGKLKSRQRWRIVFTIAVVLGFIGFGYYQATANRVKVQVKCIKADDAQLACTATQTQGTKKVNVCWSVVFECANGARPSMRACTEVKDGGSASKNLPFAEFAGADRCDQGVGAKVTNLKIDD